VSDPASIAEVLSVDAGAGVAVAVASVVDESRLVVVVISVDESTVAPVVDESRLVIPVVVVVVPVVVVVSTGHPVPF